jgi:hypothetical protein
VSNEPVPETKKNNITKKEPVPQIAAAEPNSTQHHQIHEPEPTG